MKEEHLNEGITFECSNDIELKEWHSNEGMRFKWWDVTWSNKQGMIGCLSVSVTNKQTMSLSVSNKQTMSM